MVIDAVIRNLVKIGEASNNINDEIKTKYSEILWKEMIGLRNLAAHAYFKIDLKIIWDIISKDLPDIKQKVKKLFQEL